LIITLHVVNRAAMIHAKEDFSTHYDLMLASNLRRIASK